jgi:hypothetical protein
MRLASLRRLLRVLLACGILYPGGFPPLAGLAYAANGGYSRPGSSYSYSAPSRRPSLGGNGGYARPSASSLGSIFQGGQSGDQAVSRRSSAEALHGYRASQQPAAPSESRRPYTGSGNGGWLTEPAPRRAEPAWQGGGSYANGSYGGGSGVWNAVLAWSLLNSLSNAGSSAWFRNNRNDPGYADWRAQAEQVAARDPAVARKLSELDAAMAQTPGQPRPTTAASSTSGGHEGVWIIVALGLGGFVALWVLRNRASAAASAGPANPRAPPGLSGSAASRFRVGMTMPVDPAPFLLAAGTKVKPPPADGMISVEALGLITDGTVSLHRLYLPGRETFFVLHLGPGGTPDECRYFSLLDQITPANRDEWGFWLDPAEGVIGWPQFQTKDGKLYDRVWTPGSSRVQPRQQTETIQDLTGTSQRKLQTMLYGTRAGGVQAAPAFEYVLVTAIEQGDQAWVEVHAGIDINPAALSLPAVPLSN